MGRREEAICYHEGDKAHEEFQGSQLRREMQLLPGKTVLWEKISATECLLLVQAQPVKKPDPVAAIGFAKRHGLPKRNTARWIKILREGEEE